MSERGRGRQWGLLLFVTVVCVPLSLLYLFFLLWVFPARDGYPMCDPEWQPWCKYDRTVTIRLYIGAACGVLAALSLITAYVLPRRIRLWWPWVLAPLILLPAGIALLGSLFS